MNFSIGWILTYILFAISFVGAIATAKLLTKPFDDERFAFSRVFPFETFKSVSIYRIFCYLFVLLTFGPIIVLKEQTGLLSSLDSIAVIATCAFGLASIAFLFLNLFEVVHVKVHLAIFAGFFALIMLGNVLSVVYAFTINKILTEHGNTSILLFVCAGVSVLLGLCTLAAVLNPRLMNWARLDKVEGTEDEYKRPKKFPLAYTEWMGFILLFLSEIVLYIQLLA